MCVRTRGPCLVSEVTLGRGSPPRGPGSPSAKNRESPPHGGCEPAKETQVAAGGSESHVPRDGQGWKDRVLVWGQRGSTACPARPLQRGFPGNPLDSHLLPEVPMGVTLAARFSWPPPPLHPGTCRPRVLRDWGAVWLCRLGRAPTAPAGLLSWGCRRWPSCTCRGRALLGLHTWRWAAGPGLLTSCCACGGQTARPGFPT